MSPARPGGPARPGRPACTPRTPAEEEMDR